MKKAGIVIGMILLYFVLVFAPNFLGFLSPYLWVYQPILGAFLAATPRSCTSVPNGKSRAFLPCSRSLSW